MTTTAMTREIRRLARDESAKFEPRAISLLKSLAARDAVFERYNLEYGIALARAGERAAVIRLLRATTRKGGF